MVTLSESMINNIITGKLYLKNDTHPDLLNDVLQAVHPGSPEKAGFMNFYVADEFSWEGVDSIPIMGIGVISVSEIVDNKFNNEPVYELW